MFSSHTLHDLLNSYGYAAVFGFVMVESLGIPLPGETMLITASLYAGSSHHLDVVAIWLVASAAAVVGDNIGFAIGRFGGYALLRRHGAKVHLDEAKMKVGKLVFERQGPKVVFFGRFVSVLRTYAAFLAGANRMEYRRFLAFNAAGGVIWSALYVFGFYYAGSTLSGVRGTFELVLGAGAAVIVVAALWWIRGHVRRLEAEAELAYPGPLDAHTPS